MKISTEEHFRIHLDKEGGICITDQLSSDMIRIYDQEQAQALAYALLSASHGQGPAVIEVIGTKRQTII